MNEEFEEAKRRVAEVSDEGGVLRSVGWYLYWSLDYREATLDGDYSSHELRAIADHMDAHRKK